MNVSYFPNLKYITKRLFFIVIIALIIFSIIFFKLLSIYIREFDYTLYNPLYKYTQEMLLWIYLLIFFIVLFIIGSIFLIAYSSYTVSKNRRKEEKQKKYSKLYSIEVINTICPAKDATSEEVKKNFYTLTKSLTSYQKSRVYFETLLKTSYMVKGELKERIKKLFLSSYNDAYVKKHLLSPYFPDKIFALKLIGEFKLGSYENAIKRFTNSKNFLLRSETFVALMKISDYDNLSFLEEQNQNISAMDKNIILNVIKENNKENIDILNLLTSDNEKSIHLGIMLVHKQQKLEYKNVIRGHLESSIPYIREEAFNAFMSMTESENDFDLLAQLFPTQSDIVKKAIIKNFSRCNNSSLTTALLLNAIENESVSVKVEALKVLMDVNINYMLSYKSSKDEDIQKALNQVLDFNLNI